MLITKEKFKLCYVRLPLHLHKKLKEKAKEMNIPLQSIIIEILNLWLIKENKK